MDAGAIAQSIADQFMMVWNDPIPFLAAVLFAGWLIWLLVKHEFATRLANADSTIAMLEKQLDRREASEAISIAATQAAHESATGAEVPFEARPARKLSEAEPTDAAPAQIMGLIEGRTFLQAKPLLEPYIGKAMIVSGELKNVIPYETEKVLLTMISDGLLLFCYFRTISDRLIGAESGDVVTVHGILEGVSPLGFELFECEFA